MSDAVWILGASMTKFRVAMTTMQAVQPTRGASAANLKFLSYRGTLA